MIGQLNSDFLADFEGMDLISDYTLQFNDLIPNFSTDNLAQPFDEGEEVVQSVK